MASDYTVAMSPAVESGDTTGDPLPAWLQQRSNISLAAREVLMAAGRLAPEPDKQPGARHVAKVLFCEHPVGPRLAGATCCTDVWILRRDLNWYASLSLAEASAAGLSDDPALLLDLAEAQRSADGPVDIGELILALFEAPVQLAPILGRSGLELKDVKKHLPKALRAVKIYETQALNGLGASSPPAQGETQHALLPQLSKAMRVARARDASTRAGEDSQQQKQPHSPLRSSGDGSSSSSRPASAEAEKTWTKRNPWSADEAIAEMAEMAPRAAKRATANDSVLASCGVDLVEQARNGRLDPVIGREMEITRVLQILSRRTKNNVCLIGAPGVGKTAVAEAIAQRIAAGQVPPQLRGCQELWSLDIGALLAGTGLRGDFEERLRSVLTEVRAAKGAVLLFIDELHLVLGAGRSEGNNVDAANLMKPMLARGEIRCIGATTSEEYRKLILAKDAAFERRFQVVELAEPSVEVATEMLRGLLPLYAAHHGLRLAPAVADAAVTLSHGRIRGRSLPDKAIDVLDEACSLAVEEGTGEATVAHVEVVVGRWREAPWQRSKPVALQERLTAWFKRPWSRL